MRTSVWLARLALCSLCCLWTTPALAQADAPPATAEQLRALQTAIGAVNCPGDPPGNLASFDCNFTKARRFEQFVSGSLTDQAVLGAAFYGLIGHRTGDPPEWGEGFEGLRHSVGNRYAQNLSKGLAQYALSGLIRADPRHVSYASDPLGDATKRSGARTRLGHVFVDWLTVRRSQADGKGGRLPNLPLFAGAATSALVGNALYPDRLATRRRAVTLVTSSMATALAGSAYHEFSPEIGRVLGGLFRRGRTPARTTGTPGTQSGTRGGQP